MNKAARIRELLSQGGRPVEIAAEVGCVEGYVQAVKQRVIHGCDRPADKAWRKANPEKMRARWRRDDQRARDKTNAATGVRA